MHFLLALSAFTTFTVTVRVEGKLDPREVTETTAVCTPLGTTVDICTVTDGLTWVEVLECNSRRCAVIEHYDLW